MPISSRGPSFGVPWLMLGRDSLFWLFFLQTHSSVWVSFCSGSPLELESIILGPLSKGWTAGKGSMGNIFEWDFCGSLGNDTDKISWEGISNSHCCHVHRIYKHIYRYNGLNLFKGTTHLQEIIQIQIQWIKYPKE